MAAGVLLGESKGFITPGARHILVTLVPGLKHRGEFHGVLARGRTSQGLNTVENFTEALPGTLVPGLGTVENFTEALPGEEPAGN